MTYAAQDVSVQDGAPVLLFEFHQGGSAWYMTSAADAVEVSGRSWVPGVLVPDRFAQSGSQPKDVLQIKLPIGHSLAATFLGYMPDVLTSVTVFRAHLTDGDGEKITYWKGRVSGAPASRGVVTLECESVFCSTQRMGLGPMYSRACRHALFGPGCQLDADDFAQTVSVTIVNRAIVTAPVAASIANLVGGSFKAPDGTVRTIINQAGPVLTLNRPIKSLVGIACPFDATVYPGCDKAPETCRARFSNLGNFGGCTGIPAINPMGGSNVYVF